jgi:predicted AlkP superfamily phosphohydrolase/phosphomutase
VFILEVAGPTLDFLRERRESLPNIRRFFEDGAWGTLQGPLQPVTPQSFATLLTGTNPGAHGLFDYFQFPAGGYRRVPYDTRQIRQVTLYRHLSEAGKRVGLLNVPLTFPLPDVNGFVVSGDEGIGDEFAFPAEIARRLRQDGYTVPFGASYSPGREREFAEHAMRVLDMRRRALRTLFGDCGWDFGMLTLYLYGELLHAFWKFYDRSHPEYQPAAIVFNGRDPLLEALAAIDHMLGEIVELAGPRGLVLFMGAWGHRLAHSKVHLNTVLEREGLLRFRSSARTRLKRLMFRAGVTPGTAERVARRLNLYRLFHYGLGRGRRANVTGAAFLSYGDIDWSRTAAVAMGYLGQVYLNVQGHRPLGRIPPDQYHATRDRVRRILAGLRDPGSGETVVDRVVTRDEIYRGEALTHAPDLLVEWKAGYIGDAGLAGPREIVTPTLPTHSSDHWNRSVLLALGASVRSGELSAALEDIAPTVLRALGVAAPGNLDGAVLPVGEGA